VRAAIAIVALPLVVWFAVLTRDQHVGHAGVERILGSRHVSDRDWERALSDLRAADLLDPSTDWSMTRASYLMLRDPARALRIAESIARRDPNNLPAWTLILRATHGKQPQKAARARREILRLNPPVDEQRLRAQQPSTSPTPGQ
jgi:hypothetical protein